jgi:hypothetical protein
MLIPGWTSGVLGMALGGLAALLIIVKTMKRSPWDIHDENSYQEHEGFTLNAVASPLILFTALLTLLVGLGAIDQNIWPPLAVIGDLLGLLMLVFAVYWVATGKA